MHLRESCAGCREAVGEALTAARVGRALSIVNLVRSAEAVSTVEGNTGGPATGEGRSGSAVSKTSRHARTSSIGTSYVRGNAPESESQFGTGDDSSPAVAVALHGSGGESDPSCPRVGGRRRGLARPLRRAAGWIVFFPWNQNRAVAGSPVAAIPARPVQKHGRRAVSQKARNAGIPFGRIGRIARWP